MRRMIDPADIAKAATAVVPGAALAVAAGQAIKAVAVEVYQDAAQPAVRSLGRAAEASSEALSLTQGEI